MYVLTAQGLSQLTVDDTTVPDPMDNLYEDGVLKNILSEGRVPRLRRKSIKLQAPFVVFAATDGCFGYFSTPMEFEGILLETLATAKNAARWEQLLIEGIGRVAGDDYTLCLAAYGFSSFEKMRRQFAPRLELLRNAYLDQLSRLPVTERSIRQSLWQHYQPQYSCYMKEE